MGSSRPFPEPALPGLELALQPPVPPGPAFWALESTGHRTLGGGRAMSWASAAFRRKDGEARGTRVSSEEGDFFLRPHSSGTHCSPLVGWLEDTRSLLPEIRLGFLAKVLGAPAQCGLSMHTLPSCPGPWCFLSQGHCSLLAPVTPPLVPGCTLCPQTREHKACRLQDSPFHGFPGSWSVHTEGNPACV